MKTFPDSTASVHAASQGEFCVLRAEELRIHLVSHKFLLEERQRELLERIIYIYEKEAQDIRLLDAVMKDRANVASR